LLATLSFQRVVDVNTDRARALVASLEEEAGGDLQGVDWAVDLVADRPAHAIADLAAARDADEIIIGTRRHARARPLLGSVAHEVIHPASCPVTVLPEWAVERSEADRSASAT
jgi:nucleotide-binding universal stress UspA family protein